MTSQVSEYAVTLADPINQTTDQYNVSLNYRGAKSFFSAEYYGSLFVNDVKSVAWNDISDPTKTATIAGAPSNQFHQINLTGGYTISPATKFVWNASTARNTQDEAFVTAGQNAQFPLGLPGTSLQGVVVTTGFNAKLTSKATQSLGLTANFKYENRDNQTPINTYYFQDANETKSGVNAWLAGQGSPLLDQLTGGPQRPVLVFLDATDEALVRRFESVRRPHPLQGNGRLLDAIAAERAVMADLRSEADVIVDTSGLNVHQLHAKVSSLLDASVGARVRLAVMSFGFKYGIPLDADFVMDMRFLPNPFWVPDLRAMAGTDPAVADYVLGQVDATEFLDRALAMFEPVLAGYAREGRRYATVAIGCTGGKHRSVAMTEALAARFDPERVVAFVVHRDLGRE